MRWNELIEKAVEYLDNKNVPDAAVAVECLVARLLRCKRGELFSFLQREAAEPYAEAMRRAMRRLIAKEPLQYVLGEWDFRRLTLKCDKRALIPRPETEELVSRVLKFLKERDNPFVIDVGTGTGAIILSIADEYKGDAVLIGSDVSPEALSLAKENAAKCALGHRVKFVEMDGLDDFDEPGIIDAIVSNPPYIETREIAKLDACVKDFEPTIALDGGENGLEFYDRYLQDALHLLKSGGGVFCEIGENQATAIEELLNLYAFQSIAIEKDYNGHFRYASAILP